MLPRIKLIFNDSDNYWFTSRGPANSVFPPSRDRQKEIIRTLPMTHDDLAPKRDRPPIIVPRYGSGWEGIRVGISTFHNNKDYTSERVLAVQLCPRTPLTQEWLRFACRSSAAWNPYWNGWQIPIRDRGVEAIRSIWLVIEESYFECEWGCNIELIWNLQISEENQQRLARNVARLQNDDPRPIARSLVNLPDQELIEQACDSFNRRNPHIGWKADPSKIPLHALYPLCVNHLRHHQTSGYHAELLDVEDNNDDYLKLFEAKNQEIAEAYPWLAGECNKQIQAKRNAKGS